MYVHFRSLLGGSFAAQLRTSSVIPTFQSGDNSTRITYIPRWMAMCPQYLRFGPPTSIRARSTLAWTRSVSWDHADLARMLVVRSAQCRHVREEGLRKDEEQLRFPSGAKKQRSHSQVAETIGRLWCVGTTQPLLFPRGGNSNSSFAVEIDTSLDR
jgi:hypothetical protein